jgi:hypothetical protein
MKQFNLVHLIVCWTHAKMVKRSNSSRLKLLLHAIVNILNIIMIITPWIIAIVALEESVHTLNLSGIIRKICNVAVCITFYFQTIFHVCCVFMYVCVWCTCVPNCTCLTTVVC